MAIDLHIVPHIHIYIAAYATLLMYLFVIIGLSIVPIFTNTEYWRFGVPFILQADPTEVQTLNNSAALAAIIFFLMAERFISRIRDEIVAWMPAERVPLVTQYTGIIIYYMRYAAHVVYMRSQISFVVAVIVADVLAGVMCKWISIKQRRTGASRWDKVNIYVATLAHIATIPGFLCLYAFSGLFDSPYFHIGAPLTIFGTTIVTQGAAYWSIVLATFVFACLSSAARNNIDRWHSSVLQNTGEREIGLTTWEARMIAINRMVLFYLGIMFVYSFFTTQYFFVFIYMFADMIMSTVWYARNGRLDPETPPPVDRIKKAGVTVILVTVAQTIFEVVLVTLIAMSGWFDDTYFTWGKDVVVFGAAVTGPGAKILLAYVGFDRVAATLDANIIEPDIDAWLYGGATGHIDGYDDWDVLWIIVTMIFNFWFRYVLRIMFILSNYSFVVIAAAVDIPLTIIVDEFHLAYKQNAKQVARVDGWLAGRKQK